MEPLSTCIACGEPAAGSRVVHVRRDDRLVRCRCCGLVFANPQYTDDELTALYRTEYYDEHETFETSRRDEDYEQTRVLYETVIDDILRRYPRLAPPRAARVLDFGCGVGFFLVACRTRGLRTYGIDFSETAARFARERYQLDVAADPERALAALPDASFDLITAWQVIEHLRRPREMLQELARLLAPGGVLCVAVPHLRAIGYRLRRSRWFNIQNPTHLAFFDQKNLRMLFADLGLVRLVRPVLWGGQDRGVAANLALYLARVANVGNETRLYGEKPRGA